MYMYIQKCLKYPLASVCLGLGNSDGTVRKACKSKLYDTVMYVLVTAAKAYLPGHDVMNIYFLDQNKTYGLFYN